MKIKYFSKTRKEYRSSNIPLEAWIITAIFLITLILSLLHTFVINSPILSQAIYIIAGIQALYCTIRFIMELFKGNIDYAYLIMLIAGVSIFYDYFF